MIGRQRKHLEDLGGGWCASVYSLPMRSIVRLLRLLVIPLLLSVLGIAQEKTAGPIVITHVTVINPGNSSTTPDATVVITGTRISAVSGSARYQAPKNARLIEGRG